MFKNPNEYKEADYIICFTLRFIDEDGFILYSVPSWSFQSDCEHECYNREELRYLWKNPDEENVTLKVLMNSRMNKETSKRVARVVFVPAIEIMRAEYK